MTNLFFWIKKDILI